MIKYLDYKGEKIPIIISYYALTRWSAETGLKIDQLDRIDDNLELVEPLIYHSITAGCHEEKKKNPFKREDFSFVLDHLFGQFLNEMKSFSLGMTQAQKKTVKKKQERKNFLKNWKK
jgi:hypothetical protein